MKLILFWASTPTIRFPLFNSIYGLISSASVPESKCNINNDMNLHTAHERVHIIASAI